VEMNYKNIPDLLKKCSFFCISKDGKVPLFLTKDGKIKAASCTDPKTWMEYEKAYSLLNENFKYLMIPTNGKVTAVDLDASFTSEGKLKFWAQKILNLEIVKEYAYIEKSRNSGIHIIFILDNKIENLENLVWRGNKDFHLNKNESIELFVRDHFVTLTGNAVQDNLKILLEERFIKLYEEIEEIIEELKIQETYIKIKEGKIKIKKFEKKDLEKLKNRILEKVNLEDFIPPVRYGANGNYYHSWCPFHDDGRRPGLVVYVEDKVILDCHNWKTYDIFGFLMERDKKSFKEVLIDLASRYNIELPTFKDSEEIKPIEIFNSLKDRKKKILTTEMDEDLNLIFKKEIEKIFFEGIEFPYEAIPQKLREVLKNFQKALGIPFEIVFTASLPILGTALGNAVKVEVKPGYIVNLAFWAGIIMPSGSGKTPLIKQLVSPILDKQQEIFKKEGENISALIVTDTTLEGLYRILKENKRGVLWTPQELGAVLGIINEYKKRGADRQRLIQLFDGNPVVIMRKTEGLMFIPRVEVNLLGGIQAEIFPKLFNKSFFEDGLIQRFLWISGESELLSEEGITPENYIFYRNLIKNFFSLPLKEEDAENFYIIRFSEKVKKLFIEKGNTIKEISENFFTPQLRTFINKVYFYYLPRLAGLLACLEIYEMEGNLNKIQKEEIKIDEDIFRNALLLTFYYIEAGRKVFELYGRKKALDEHVMTIIKIVAEFFKDKEILKVPLKEVVEKFKSFLGEKFNPFSFSVDVNSKTIAKILRKLGFKVEKGSKGRTFIYFTPEAKELVRSFSEYRSYHSVKKKPEILKLVEDLKEFNNFSEQFIESASVSSDFENFNEYFKKLQKESELTPEQLEVIEKYWR